jgi:hypothetical protein
LATNIQYRIYCRGQKEDNVEIPKLYMEAFPNYDVVRPTTGFNQDTFWFIDISHSDYYYLKCKTKNGGWLSIEAFPNSDKVSVKSQKDINDFKWKLSAPSSSSGVSGFKLMANSENQAQCIWKPILTAKELH